MEQKKDWVKDLIVYQVYPRSFQDSNGDGIGDIPGILSRLDHLSALGINALWLSPVFRSPNDDNGYDISGYREIMDEFGTVMLPVKGGKHFTEMSMGRSITDYDSMVVYTHFKGHTMGGYGGSLKNIGIGCADGKVGKRMIHAKDGSQWGRTQDEFMEAMTESAKAVVDHFGKRITFINVMKNMSVDCDCCAVAEDPCIKDMGVLVSTDPVAIDQACLDLVYASDDPGKAHFIERVESRNGVHTIEAAAELGIGSREYELVTVE